MRRASAVEGKAQGGGAGRHTEAARAGERGEEQHQRGRAGSNTAQTGTERDADGQTRTWRTEARSSRERGLEDGKRKAQRGSSGRGKGAGEGARTRGVQCARKERRWREKTATERAGERRTDVREEAESTASGEGRAGQRWEGGGAGTARKTEEVCATRKNAADAHRARA